MGSQGQVLSHIGVCTVNGFRVQIPYLVKELAHLMYESHGEPSFNNDTLVTAINLDFNEEEDRKILGSTKDFCYWWKNTGESKGNIDPTEEELPRVTHSVTASHFKAFWRGVSTAFYWTHCCSGL